MIKRLGIILFLIAAVVFTGGRAAAQTGACPDWVEGYGIFLPPGWYPYEIDLCTPDPLQGDIDVVFGPDYPCNAGLMVDDNWRTWFDGWPDIIVSPPSNFYMGQGANIKFQLWADVVNEIHYDQLYLQVRSMDGGGEIIHAQSFAAGDFPYEFKGCSWIHGCVRIYEFNVLMPAVTGGSFAITVTSPGPLYLNNYLISGLQIVPVGGSAPPTCYDSIEPEIPTPTPTPGDTPTPTITPSHSPTPTSTPWPTSPGGTPTQLPTSTPYAPSTVPAEPTGTPMVFATLPALQIPTVSIPSLQEIPTPAPFTVGLTANATTEARQEEMAEWNDVIAIAATRWYTETTEAFFIIDGGGQSQATMQDMADQMVENVAQPVGQVKGLALYLPNTWAYIWVIFLMFLWVVLQMSIKFSISLLWTVVDLLLRLWGAVPFKAS